MGSMQISADVSNQVYNWQLEDMPTSISQLQGPWNLDISLHIGLDHFDIVQDPARSASEKILRSLYPANSYSRSAHRHASFRANSLPREAFSGPTSRYIRLEYHMISQPGFDWVKGGKLGGLFSGINRGSNAGCSGLEKRRINEVRIPESDENNDNFHDTKLVKCGNNSCLRGMRVKISHGAVNHCNPAFGISIGRGGSFKFQSGRWELVIEVQDLVLLKNGHGPTILDQVKFMFSSFFGGNTADYATPIAQWIT
ncbi:hypothetical protein MVEG_06376 [Podila verticillata NRRL 6337]|nr:hypothetical protein MVEG_06376 [Podila verticillata NRRL 6337]